MKTIKLLIRIVIYLLFMYGLYVVCILTYATVTDWLPKENINLQSVNNHTSKIQKAPVKLKFLTWNLGFGALGAETDFFYDGGKVVIQEESVCRKNVDGIKSFLDENRDVDFFLLQEVDSNSRRNHRINMQNEIATLFNSYESYFALNYNIDYIPVPHTEPMGEVRSGLLSLSKYKTDISQRVSFDTQFEWPRQVFFLDRCFLKQEILLENGKTLIIINTHCSAYDKEGGFVKAEIQKMIDFSEYEYVKGNYVVIGGDWNQLPPNYQAILPNEESDYNEINLTNDQIPNGWKWVADPSTPTNRKLDIPYTKENSYTTVIDHYLISPNVKINEVKTIDLQFQFTDHQPVILEVELD